MEKNYARELLNVKVFTDLTECYFKVISRVGKENRTSGGILILVLNKVGLCALMRLSFYSNEAFFTNYGDIVVLVRFGGLRTYFNNTGVTGSLVVSFSDFSRLYFVPNCGWNSDCQLVGKNWYNGSYRNVGIRWCPVVVSSVDVRSLGIIKPEYPRSNEQYKTNIFYENFEQEL